MTSRRFALHELSAYHERRRRAFPWHAVNWGGVYMGAGLCGLACLLIFAAVAGWAS